MGYYELASAPNNFVLPTPVKTPSLAGSKDMSEEREDLHKLIDTLDAGEVKVVTQYVANLLLAGVQATAEKTRSSRPSCF